MSESARSVKGSILSDCHQTKISILKYLTAVKPQANQETRTLELRCLEIDETMISYLLKFVKNMISIDQDVLSLTSDDLKV